MVHPASESRYMMFAVELVTAEALSLEVSADAAAIVATVLADSAIAAAESTILDIAVAQPIRVLAFHDGGFSLTEVEQALTSGAEQGALGGLGRFMRHEPGPPGIAPRKPEKEGGDAAKLSKTVRNKLGNLAGRADELAAGVIRVRGGGGGVLDNWTVTRTR